ncbi:phosphate propanoyltransferase [Peptoniphilus sp. MSJ-1]|uniref:Phosphate propanoyltransferase n=1 Tax=Peptoniphilus ovalis TaxID=2841503 RepID=A0ABS6FHY1_9FIRM|nr:phosphate propanoyltransferase [Peptoniphilus ovalis]MBU5669764.1 phosphate propanoyltransferase [Peptoniphilus ovalis]
MLDDNELIAKVSNEVFKRINSITNHKIVVGVSNRHVHLSKEDLESLFGKGYELTVKSKLKQPGQFAAEECVTIRGPKGEFKKVRILGPVRSKSQVEISLTDSFKLGVKAPIKESGKLEGTPGIELIGPCGKVNMPNGTIIALRHIHMTPEDAKFMEVNDGDFVDVQFFGERKAIMGNVLIRVSDKYKLEMHLDTDEANAVGIKNNDFVVLRKFVG